MYLHSHLMIPPNTLFISQQPNQINPTLDSYHRSLDSLQLCLHLAVHLIWSPRGMAEPDSLTTFLWYVFIEPRCAGGINRASWFSITGGPTIRHHLRWNATDKVKTIENGKKGCVGWVVLAEVTQGWPTATRAIFLAASPPLGPAAECELMFRGGCRVLETFIRKLWTISDSNGCGMYVLGYGRIDNW